MTAIAREKRITDEEYLSRIMKVFPDEEEARNILAYDRDVEKDETELLEHDLSAAEKVISQKYTKAGIRKPMVLNLTPRERKPNATKGGLVAELAAFMSENSGFDVKNLIIPNKEGKISFKIGDLWYTWALTEHKRVIPEWIKKEIGEK